MHEKISSPLSYEQKSQILKFLNYSHFNFLIFNYKKNFLCNDFYNIFLIFYKQNLVTLYKFRMPEIFFLSHDSRAIDQIHSNSVRQVVHELDPNPILSATPPWVDKPETTLPCALARHLLSCARAFVFFPSGRIPPPHQASARRSLCRVSHLSSYHPSSFSLPGPSHLPSANGPMEKSSPKHGVPALSSFFLISASS